MLGRSISFCLAVALLTTPAAGQQAQIDLLRDELHQHEVGVIFRSKMPLPAMQVPYSNNGTDDREDAVRLPANHPGRRCAPSTCLLTSKGRVALVNNRYQLALRDFIVSDVECCPGERFGDQKRGGFGSGFLAAGDIVITAGHCCQREYLDVKNIAFVFGFSLNANGKTPATFDKDQVYFGKDLVRRVVSDDGDYAIIRLDRAVNAPGALPLRIAPQPPARGTDIFLVGYPSGLPCKICRKAQVMEQVLGGRWLRTDCDAFSGNSGSPIVDDDGLVVGILIRGGGDYWIDGVDGKPCFKAIGYSTGTGNEIALGPQVFRGAVPGGP